IVRALGDANDAQKEEHEQRERDQHADEPKLLTDHGEDEVGVLLREKGQSLLRTLQVAAPEPATRSDRDDRLQDVITATARIDRRIEKDLQPLLPVARHVLPEG